MLVSFHEIIGLIIALLKVPMLSKMLQLTKMARVWIRGSGCPSATNRVVDDFIGYFISIMIMSSSWDTPGAGVLRFRRPLTGLLT